MNQLLKIYFGGAVLCLMSSINCFAQTYCTSQAIESQYEWIEKVQLATYQNFSGNNDGYGDFTNDAILLWQLSKPTLKLTPGISANNISPSEYWRVWIDYNHDGDFMDANELVFDSNGTFEIAIEGEFTVPYYSTPGETRMRVAMKFINTQSSELPQACGGFLYGEIEDYTVNIKETNLTIDTTSTNIHKMNTPLVNIYPKPANNYINLQLMNTNLPLQEVGIFDVKGQEILKLTDNFSSPININSLSNGMYILKATFRKGTEIMERFTVVK